MVSSYCTKYVLYELHCCANLRLFLPHIWPLHAVHYAIKSRV